MSDLPERVVDRWYLKVYSADILGSMPSAESQKTILKDVKASIERHVDDGAGEMYLENEGYYVCGSYTYDRLFDALLDEADEGEAGIPYYSVNYMYSRDIDRGGCKETHDLREVYETAFWYPHGFVVIVSQPPLSSEQQEFLESCINLGLRRLASR